MREVKADPTFPVERLAGVEFAHPGGRCLLLDAVYPAGPLHGEPDGPRPVILHVGEPWISGQRSADPWYHAYFATHGFFAASCDVRSFAEAPFPAQLHDVKAALRWLRTPVTRGPTASTPPASACGASRSRPRSPRWPVSPATAGRRSWRGILALPAERGIRAQYRRWCGPVAPRTSRGSGWRSAGSGSSLHKYSAARSTITSRWRS